jgi:hypothetical protein
MEQRMDKKLQWLDSFQVRGNDGQAYKVMAYEHLMRVDLAPGREHWESTGLTEYRLDTGERVDVAADGAMRVTATGVELRPAERAEPAASGERKKAHDRHARH